MYLWAFKNILKVEIIWGHSIKAIILDLHSKDLSSILSGSTKTLCPYGLLNLDWDTYHIKILNIGKDANLKLVSLLMPS